jgi:hypothetical protein
VLLERQRSIGGQFGPSSSPIAKAILISDEVQMGVRWVRWSIFFDSTHESSDQNSPQMLSLHAIFRAAEVPAELRR